MRALVLGMAVLTMAGDDTMAMRELTPRRVAQSSELVLGQDAPTPGLLPKGSHDLSYLDKLDELRAHYDLQPFLEPLAAGTPGETGPAGVVFPAGSVANDVKVATRSRKYSMIAEELLGWILDLQPGTGSGLGVSLVSANISEYQGQRPEHQPPYIRDELLLGNVGLALNPYRNGLFLPDDVQQTLSIQLRTAVPASHNATFYATYRGYRLYEKGSQRPIQYSYAEYAARGYQLAPYPQSVVLTLPVAPSTDEAPPVELSFPDDMVIDAMVVEANQPWLGYPGDPRPSLGNVLARIEPTQGAPVTGGWVSLPAIGYAKRETSARWPIPFSVAKDQSWRFRARKAYDDDNGSAIAVTITLLGSKLIPPKR